MKPLVRSILIPLRLIAASSTDAAIHNRIVGSGMTTPIISIREIHGMMKTMKSLEGAGLLIKGVSATIQMKHKNKKVDFSACN